MIVWPTCTNAAAVRPARVIIACADANLYATGVRCNSRLQFARIEWSGKQHGSYTLGCRT